MRWRGERKRVRGSKRERLREGEGGGMGRGREGDRGGSGRGEKEGVPEMLRKCSAAVVTSRIQ